MDRTRRVSRDLFLLTGVMSGGQAIDRCGESLPTRLHLDPHVERVGAGPGQVPAVNPQTGLLGRLPHVAQLAFPGSRVTIGIGTQSPNLAHLVGSLLGNQRVRPRRRNTMGV